MFNFFTHTQEIPSKNIFERHFENETEEKSYLIFAYVVDGE